jgi:hypothetical protein
MYTGEPSEPQSNPPRIAKVRGFPSAIRLGRAAGACWPALALPQNRPFSFDLTRAACEKSGLEETQLTEV